MNDMPMANYTKGHTMYFLEPMSKLFQLNTKSGKVIKYLGSIAKVVINKLTISPNSKHLYTVDEPARFRHWDLTIVRLAKGWEYEANTQGGCFSLVVTPDNEYVFLWNNCEVTQICLDTKELVYQYNDYHKIHSCAIVSMCVTSDNKYLVTCSGDYQIKKVSIVDRKIVQENARWLLKGSQFMWPEED